MKRENVLSLLRAHQEELRAEYGVKSLVLFGSVARDEAGPASDVDLLVEFNKPTGYFGLVRLQLRLEEILGCAVDLGTPGALRPAMRHRIREETICVG
jgi:predicted nucleotidyltransferase